LAVSEEEWVSKISEMLNMVMYDIKKYKIHGIFLNESFDKGMFYDYI